MDNTATQKYFEEKFNNMVDLYSEKKFDEVRKVIAKIREDNKQNKNLTNDFFMYFNEYRAKNECTSNSFLEKLYEPIFTILISTTITFLNSVLTLLVCLFTNQDRPKVAVISALVSVGVLIILIISIIKAFDKSRRTVILSEKLDYIEIQAKYIL